MGVPDRGLHGEAYRGHVFWDELFVLPYLNLRFPEASRALLTYRHRRLPQAWRAAARAGRAGAMYPWQSGSDGREETQQPHLNPRSGRRLPDHSRLQHHVGSAIAYNVWQYCEATGDTEFLHTKGAEMLLQVARFWADMAVFDPESGRAFARIRVDADHDRHPAFLVRHRRLLDACPADGQPGGRASANRRPRTGPGKDHGLGEGHRGDVRMGGAPVDA